MEVNLGSLGDHERYKLLMSSVVPRPIALVTSIDRKGLLNAAPFSLFNMMAASPPTVVLGIDCREPGMPKDTVRNIQETGEFVVNLVNEALAGQMSLCAAGLPHGENEAEYANLPVLPSIQVKAPRIADSPINLECRRAMAIDIGNERTIVVGTVLHYHIDDRYFDADRQHVLADRIGLIARMHGRSWYARTSDLFELERSDASRLG